MHSTKIKGPELQPSDTSPNDQGNEHLNSKLDIPRVSVNENVDVVSAVRQFLDKEGAKGNPRVSFCVVRTKAFLQ